MKRMRSPTPKYFSALPRHSNGFLRQVHCRDLRTMAGEVDGVRADAAADLQHLFAPPALEFCELGDVRLDKVLTRFHFVEVFPRAYRLRGMRDVARPRVPIVVTFAIVPVALVMMLPEATRL